MAVAQRFFVINCSKYHHRVWYTTIGYTFVKLYLPCTIYHTGLRENNASLHGIMVLKFKLYRNSFFIFSFIFYSKLSGIYEIKNF